MIRLLAAGIVVVISLGGCGGGIGTEASRDGASLRVVRPAQNEVIPVRSVGVEVEVSGLSGYSLHYVLDGADQGIGQTSATFTDVQPGRHRIEIEAVDAAGRPLSPALRVGADFTVQ